MKLKSLVFCTLLSAGAASLLEAADPLPQQTTANAPTSSAETAARIVLPFEITATGHQMVKVTIKGETLRLLVDSGSGGDLLDSETVLRLKLKAKQGGGMSLGVGGAGGAIGTLETVDCQMNGKPLKIDFHSMNLGQVKMAGGDGGVDGILGSPFLQNRHAVLDFGAKTLAFDADPS